jgi:cytochrome c553
MLSKMRKPLRAAAASCLLGLALGALPSSVTNADAGEGEKKVQLCILCHKPNNPESVAPMLDGQPREYLVAQLKAYKEKRRSNTVMQTNAMSLSERDIRDIADYFASRKPARVTYNLDPAKVALGVAITEKLQCRTCHGPNFSGGKDVPRLAGMEPRYTAWQLLSYATGMAKHPPADGITSLTREDTVNIAQYLAGL